MGLHIKTMGCNGLCRSCYENRIRSVNLDTSYDIKAILETLESETLKTPENQRSGSVCIHGGEPLLMRFEDVEKLLAKMYELYGYSNIQTNGILINDRYIELFKKYKTSIGVSIDGDTAQLNYGRWNGENLTMAQVQKATDRVLDNMKKVHEAGVSLSIIALLRRYNADKENISDFIRFLLKIRDELDIVHVRTNECIVYEEKWKAEEQLTNEEMGYALCRLADVVLTDHGLFWNPYRDIVNMMFGYTNESTCVFGECDVWQTGSERTIMADGSMGSCLKGAASVDGLQVLRSEGEARRDRYTVLAQIPQEQEGCKDCRYWFLCKAGCPGEGVDNDWRNKTRFCGALKHLYEYIETRIKGLVPNVNTLPDFYPVHPSPTMVQAAFGQGGSTWKEGKRKNVEELKKCVEDQKIDPFHGDGHGDGHGDRPHGDSGHADGHGDSGHGDSGHGDSGHGDSGHGDRPHGDSYRDSGHADGHGDLEHGDGGHGDRPHGDGHGDKHGDSGHGDGSHGDRPHGDA